MNFNFSKFVNFEYCEHINRRNLYAQLEISHFTLPIFFGMHTQKTSIREQNRVAFADIIVRGGGIKISLLYVCSILGMHLFGCKFCDPALIGTKACGRKNFDSLLWAIITVFQVHHIPIFRFFSTRLAMM